MGDIEGESGSIYTVAHIIDYFNRAKEQPVESTMLEHSEISVVIALQEGDFIPDVNAGYFEASRWRHYDFQLKADIHGLVRD
ncbi:hypothetical protein MNBD_GAMMA09-1817 [hydrothermal vent metagenome]|uniref:Uncharacterized protein n=1 Tax=hydrothermal vent metagenome TaxID=652676 RepID=A0A3B0XIR9_9ZZZZ